MPKLLVRKGKKENARVGRSAPFLPVSEKCNLYILEKFEIIFNPKKASLNSRHESFSACRHKWAALLVQRKEEKGVVDPD